MNVIIFPTKIVKLSKLVTNINFARRIIADLNKRLADRELSVELTPEAEQFIVDNAYDPVYGARPLKRYIQKTVETLSAKLILSDAVEGGDTILITLQNGELTAQKKA